MGFGVGTAAAGLAVGLLAAAGPAPTAAAPADSEVAAEASARNVVLMIADGAGFNAWVASAMYQGMEPFYREPDWVQLAATTYALRQTRVDSTLDPLAQDRRNVYDPVRAWDATPATGGSRGYSYFFEGYRWLRRAPDSANTATSLSTGRKTYVGAINVDGAGRAIEETIASLAKSHGRRVGIVTDVPLSHATPAALAGVHSASRRQYCAIAFQMLTSPRLDVIAGCGHPDFDNNGQPVHDDRRRDYRYVGGRAVWKILNGGGADVAPTSDGGEGQSGVVCSEYGSQARPLQMDELEALRRWTLVESREEIERLAGGATPSHLLMVPKAGQVGFWRGWTSTPADSNLEKRGGTLQQERGSRADPRYTEPGYDPVVESVPTLASLTRAALNALDDGPGGFFLMVEGGAVDWAMHGNQMGRMIEEMIAFETSVNAVLQWIEQNDARDETLVIVTADHDHLLWGPRSNTEPFAPLVDCGAGRLPGYRWLSKEHSSALVPVFARGPGSELLLECATKTDPRYGSYLDQTDIFAVMKAVFRGQPLSSR